MATRPSAIPIICLVLYGSLKMIAEEMTITMICNGIMIAENLPILIFVNGRLKSNRENRREASPKKMAGFEIKVIQVLILRGSMLPICFTPSWKSNAPMVPKKIIITDWIQKTQSILIIHPHAKTRTYLKNNRYPKCSCTRSTDLSSFDRWSFDRLGVSGIRTTLNLNDRNT